MGNYIEKVILGEHHKLQSNSNGVQTKSTTVQLTNSLQHMQMDFSDSINFHIYSYKQHMQQKERQLFKWAAAKLALTDELLKAHQMRSRMQLKMNSKFSHISKWQPQQEAHLTDDEGIDEDVDKNNGHNSTDLQEYRYLQKYRGKLMEVLTHLLKTKSRKKSGGLKQRIKRKKLLSKCAALSGVKMNTLKKKSIKVRI